MLYILNTSQNSLISFDSTKNCLDVASFPGRPDRIIAVFVLKQEISHPVLVLQSWK